MYPTLQAKLQRFEEIESQLQDPVVLADVEGMLALQREHGGLRKVATSIRDFNKLEQEVNDTKQMIYDESDQEAREYARAELAEIEPKFETLRAELEDILTAGDSMTRGSLIMEIRAGTGGEEAALFARNLFEMYSIFVNARGWKLEVLEMSDAEMGGIKEVTLSVSGEGCFHQLQFESGGHRVQRVPETESQGRVHTSAATVAVLPEVQDIEVEIRDEDIRMDTMRAGGPGGQKVNKTESAVRLTHIPTNIVVRCQDEKSQHKNRARAMRLLRSKIYEQRQQKLDSDRASARRTLIGSGDRSERIRTYNFPQNRLTDHRIGLTLYKLDRIMQGELDDLISQMLEFDRNERLKGNIEIGS
ncbi:MAG: peptide chain release factor 1 [Planctomycetia bacterium]|nr:peptide chain release factor 1 [Planctomycetia bacterium]